VKYGLHRFYVNVKTMKTTKSTTVPNSIRTSRNSEPVKVAKPLVRRARPSEEEIRKKAEEIYHQRISRGEQGNAVDDWRKAEELLSGAR